MTMFNAIYNGVTAFLRDYKEQLSYGSLASMTCVVASIGIGIGGMFVSTATQGYCLKLVYYLLGAGIVFYCVSKSPELWGKYATNIMKTRFGIDVNTQAGTVTDTIDPNKKEV